MACHSFGIGIILLDPERNGKTLSIIKQSLQARYNAGNVFENDGFSWSFPNKSAGAQHFVYYSIQVQAVLKIYFLI